MASSRQTSTQSKGPRTACRPGPPADSLLTLDRFQPCQCVSGPDHQGPGTSRGTRWCQTCTAALAVPARPLAPRASTSCTQTTCTLASWDPAPTSTGHGHRSSSESCVPSAPSWGRALHHTRHLPCRPLLGPPPCTPRLLACLQDTSASSPDPTAFPHFIFLTPRRTSKPQASARPWPGSLR